MIRGGSKLVYKELDTESLIEIDSVSSFIGEIKKLKISSEGASTELYFRGQNAEFWGIEPSVFRDDMLSIEHKLMKIPLQKIPNEFKDFHTVFDIMTKYQHYGMCTRLLDLTTNPLVALYFACQRHGEETYIDDGIEVSHEPYGVIYFARNYYPLLPTDREIKIISELASYDLSKENTVLDVLSQLNKDGIIDNETKNKWLKPTGFSEFIDIIQRNYMVTPTYTNERLKKQSGVFLLASLFTVANGSDIAKSVISKAKDNLRKEFEDTYFYIRGENKKEILKELNLYNINEATLFPELEHQLNYIKNINSEAVTDVALFENYTEYLQVENIQYISDENELNQYILSNLSNILVEIVGPNEIDELKKIIENDLVVDWYNRETIMSKMRMSISGYYFVKTKNKNETKKKAAQIIELLKQAVTNYACSNKK